MGHNESNFKIKGDGKINKDVTAGFSMEIRNDFSVVGFPDQSVDQHGPDLQPRSMYVFVKSSSLGEIRLARTTAASDDGWYQELGTSTVGGLAGDLFAGGFKFRDNTAAHSLTGYTWTQALGEWTDSSSVNRITYIKPTLGGFVGKVAFGGADAVDASLSWTGKFDTFSAVAGVGNNAYQEHELAKGGFGKGIGTKQTDYGFSGSISESGSGLFLTGAYGVATVDDSAYTDKTFYMIHGGWAKNVTALGLTTIDAQYYKANNGVNDFNLLDKAAGMSSTGHTIGFGIDQALDPVDSNTYLHAQRDTLDPSAEITAKKKIDSQSIDSITAGMIVRF